MSKAKTIILDNGLKILLYIDNNKNRTIGTLYTFAGGSDTHFILDGKEYNQVNGIAHFLEHYLLEKSKYGNLVGYYDNEYIGSNGSTNQSQTTYFINTVHDFEDNFVKLLESILDPKFSEVDFDDVKKPILSEIDRSNDNPYLEYNKFIYSKLYKNIKHNITLGTQENIKNLTVDDIKLFYDAFYRPSNQMIVLSGNIDEERIVKVISDLYDKYKRDYKELVKDEIHEPVQVVESEGTFVDKDKDEVVELLYKIDISNLTPEERVKTDFYLSYATHNTFSEKAEIFNIIREREISPYSPNVEFDVTLDKDLFCLSIDLTTSKHDEAIKLLEDTLSNLIMDEETFNIFKNRILMNSINKSEVIHMVARNSINLLLDYNYEMEDDIAFVNSLTLEECKEMVNKIDFSNKCIIKRIKGE